MNQKDSGKKSLPLKGTELKIKIPENFHDMRFKNMHIKWHTVCRIKLAQNSSYYIDPLLGYRNKCINSDMGKYCT